jgi:hypothetical protein
VIHTKYLIISLTIPTNNLKYLVQLAALAVARVHLQTVLTAIILPKPDVPNITIWWYKFLLHFVLYLSRNN